jgi:hypothetical protein
MTTHDDFLQKQIAAQLREAKYEEAVAMSSAMAAVDHQRSNPRIKLPELLAWARTHAKHSRRIKDKPDRPHVPGRRMGLR